jgi:hypothetical protein
MKEKKSCQLRVRLSESQIKRLIEYVQLNPQEFKNTSELVRKSITDKICRKKDTSSK